MNNIDFKLFFKTFFITLFLLMFMFFSAYIIYTPNALKDVKTVQRNVVVPKQPNSTLLFMISTDKNSTPIYYNMVSMNPQKDTIYVCSIHKDTAVYLNEEDSTLTQSFAYGGPLQAVQSFNDAYSINVNNYINVTFDEYGKFLDSIGNIDFNVFMDIFIKDEFDRTVFKIDNGKNTLTGYTASNLIRYSPLTYEENLILNIDILHSYIKQNLGKKNIEVESVLSEIESDITSTNIDKIKKSISGLSDNFKIKTIHLTGDMVNDAFYLDNKSIEEVININ